MVGKPFDLDGPLDGVERAVGCVTPFERAVGCVTPFERARTADTRRTAALAAALDAAGAQDVVTGTRRAWATFTVGDELGLIYWSQRNGVYCVLREPTAGGPTRQIGRFHDLDAAVVLATAP